MGVIFASIGAAELLVALGLLLAGNEVTMLMAFIFGLQGIIFGSVGAGFLFSNRRKQLRRDGLISNGYYEIATVVSVERNPMLRINGRQPYIVVCRIERDGVLHEYRSDSLFSHPGLNDGDLIPVYLDPQDEKRYYVDVESASPTIIQH